jgi:hypothetical protein
VREPGSAGKDVARFHGYLAERAADVRMTIAMGPRRLTSPGTQRP